MRRVPIRMKLAAALTVPLLGLFVITTVEVAQTARQVDRVRAQTQLARASIGPSGIINNLQNERTWAVADMIGAASQIAAPVKGYDQTRKATDDAIAGFRKALADEGPAVRQAYAPALAGLDRLTAVRTKIDGSHAAHALSNSGNANKIFGNYSDLITPFFDADTRVALAVDDAQLRQWTTLAGVTTRQSETIANLSRRTVLDGVIGGGIDTPDEITAESQLKGEFDHNNTVLTDAPAPYADVIAQSFPHQLVDGLSGQLDNALTGKQINLGQFLAAINIPPEKSFIGLSNVLGRELTARADTLDRQATARERLYIAIAMITLLAALLLSWLVTRSITRALRSLTRQAKDMAERRLPDAVNNILETPLGEDVTFPEVPPVRTDTSDEVADVASALNTVQDTALDLAIEQAVLRRNIADSFVNLGRRNQGLLGRQLDFITELESNETEPDALANLFRLDHLATRMRRNAESLLVLAGFDPPRQWAAPVRLTDVIRAALGEVEEYHRVVVRGIEPATILGSTAADLAHLLAELVENALVFSPPDQNVQIRGRQRDPGPPGHGAYTLAVIDTGLGMPATDLAAANRRLAGAESFTIAPSKYLGHYVAGNLAARHGIRVHLDHSPGNGITATITLPPSLLTTDAVTTDPVTPPHGQRLARVRPGTALPGPRPVAPEPDDEVAAAQHDPGDRPAVGAAWLTAAAAAAAARDRTAPAGLAPPPAHGRQAEGSRERRVPGTAGPPGAGYPPSDQPAAPAARHAPAPLGTPDPYAAGATGTTPGTPPDPYSTTAPGTPPDPYWTAAPAPGGAAGDPDRPALHIPGDAARRARLATPIPSPSGKTGGPPPAPGAAPAPAAGLPRRPIAVGPIAPVGQGAPPAANGAGPVEPPPALWPRSRGASARPGSEAGPTRPAPPRPDDRSLLDALGRYAPPTGPAPGPAAPGLAASAPLAQRVRGAQLPETRLVPLRAEDRLPPDRRRDPTGPTPRVTPAAHASAADVQSLLTNFSAGVQRGLAEVRHRHGDNGIGNGGGRP